METLKTSEDEMKKKKRTYNYNEEQIKIIRATEYNKGAIDSLKVFASAAVLILHEEFGFGSVKKLPRFIDAMNRYYKDWYDGKTNAYKLAEQVKDKTGIIFRDKEEKQ